MGDRVLVTRGSGNGACGTGDPWGGMHEHPCPDDEPEQLHVGLPCA